MSNSNPNTDTIEIDDPDMDDIEDMELFSFYEEEDSFGENWDNDWSDLLGS